ncbi:hypothetical protein BH18THE2_BH18THE2_20550 [soil metagenome]
MRIMYPLSAKRNMLVIWTWILVGSISLLNMNITNPIQAETGKGEDVFKVIMTIFGVDKSKGDVVAIVTANNGEASRVKFLDSEAPYVVPINSRGVGGSSSHLVEYVATFPNITVNAGDEYKACVLTTKDLSPDGLICNTGQNSPANRPEFVDISLNATTTNSEDRLMEEGEDRTSEDEDDHSFLSVK